MNENLPLVCGHRLEPEQMLAFETWCLGKTRGVAAVAKAVGVDVAIVKKWMHSVWWQELGDRYIQVRQGAFHRELARRSDEVAKAFFDVVNKKDSEDRTANARINAVRLFAEMGKDPLVNRRPALQVVNNTVINKGTINIEKLRALPSERLLEIAYTGDVPEEVMG